MGPACLLFQKKIFARPPPGLQAEILLDRIPHRLTAIPPRRYNRYKEIFFRPDCPTIRPGGLCFFFRKECFLP